MKQKKMVFIIPFLPIFYYYLFACSSCNCLFFSSPELIRLIHTSGDETKKAMIRESLNILDSPRKKHPNGKRLNSHGILFQHANAFETETVDSLSVDRFLKLLI
jgi:hypothetical protein